ncbi:hypothetical protein ARAM_001364 [Aspergillus rambellii]|uniref:F-box domain-containing protein n=1 Tax=Aspergillus rambellii TaxID=308745 RepID=A0A0F8W338_9EURO|nr:hypothetical protein ARAM_001364 [Aspergillus rambellii]
MPFISLPEDILLLFIKCLERDTQTLAPLATCCKKLNRITTPILYAHVTLGLDKGDESRKVRRFIKSVFTNPFLAQCVRSLELNALYWISHYLQSLHRKELLRALGNSIAYRPDKLDIMKLITVVQRLPLPEDHKLRWCIELQEPTPSLDSLIAILFVFLPSIQRLESNWSSDAVFISHILPTTNKKVVDSSPSPHVLANLSHLKVNSECPCGNFAEIIPFFQMPSLSHFFGSNWGPIRRDGWDDGVEDEADPQGYEGDGMVLSPIIHLELRHCSVDLFSLQTILRQCRSVKTFIFHRDWDPRIHIKFSALSIAKALLPLWNKLENIRLSFEPGIYIHDEAEISPLDFSHFSVLTKLYVSAGYIIHDPQDFDPHEFSKASDPGSDDDSLNFPLHTRLPRSLEVLRIMGFSTPEQAQFLIDDCCRLLQHHHQFPRLSELCIEARFYDTNSRFDTSALQNEAQRAGVLLRRLDNTEFHLNDKQYIHTPSGFDWGMDGEFEWGIKLYDYEVVELAEEEIVTVD